MFVTNVRSGQRADIEQYLETYDLNPYFGVSPASPALPGFISDMEQLFRPL